MRPIRRMIKVLNRFLLNSASFNKLEMQDILWKKYKDRGSIKSNKEN